jgi:O-antigen biosynthesis protein WbqP
MKRVLDVFTSLLGLALLWPVIAIAALAIRIESKGNPFFAQTRVGQHARHFTCYKLRTMYIDTKHVPSHQLGQSAVTAIGQKLRKWKVDEIPQLWNVLVGEMSLVGPRPCLPSQTELIAARCKRGVLQSLPGITGLAQVQGVDMSHPERLAERDAEYLRIAGFSTDLKLLLATLSGKGLGVDRIVTGDGDKK